MSASLAHSIEDSNGRAAAASPGGVCLQATRSGHLGRGRDPAFRRILVHRLRQAFRQPRKDLFPRQSGLFGQRRKHLWPNRLFELRRDNLLVWSTANSGIGDVAVAGLLKSTYTIPQPPAQQVSNTGAGEHSIQLSRKTGGGSRR